MEMNGGSTASYLAHTPRVPLFMLGLIGLKAKGLFRLAGATRDHFRCAVEPSPGQIRFRMMGSGTNCLPPDEVSPRHFYAEGTV